MCILFWNSIREYQSGNSRVTGTTNFLRPPPKHGRRHIKKLWSANFSGVFERPECRLWKSDYNKKYILVTDVTFLCGNGPLKFELASGKTAMASGKTAMIIWNENKSLKITGMFSKNHASKSAWNNITKFKSD